MTTALLRPSVPAAWRQPVVALVVLVGALLALYRDTAASMVDTWWRSQTFAHGFVVPVIVLWLLWRRRHALAAVAPSPTAWMLLPMAAAGALWLLGDLAAVNAAAQLALTVLLVSLVVAVIGWRAARVIAFPLGFLFFAVPIGEFMMPQLMIWTADFTGAAVRLSGVPVYREGLQIIIPTGTWSIVEACSGIRYLIASVMVGTLFAYLHYRSLRRRLMFIGVSILVPIVANWIRAYLIVMIGHLSDNRLATGVDHLVYGWVFFGIVIILTFLIGARWSEPAATPPREAGQPIAHAPVPLGAFWLVAGVAALLAVAPRVAVDRLSHPAAGVPPLLAEAPAMVAAWRPATGPASELKPAFIGPSAESHRTYERADARRVGVYIGYYRDQDYGRKLVSSENGLLARDDEEWIFAARGRRTIVTPAASVDVRTMELRPKWGWASGRRITAWQLYWINGTLTDDDVRAKVYGAAHRLLGRGDDAAVVVLHTSGNGAQAAAVLDAFLQDHLGVLQAQLSATRDGEWVSKQVTRGKEMP